MIKLNYTPVDIYQDIKEFNRLLEIVEEISPKRILEIGSLSGGTIWNWLNIESVKQLISIDLLVDKNDARYEAQHYGHKYLWNQWALSKSCEFAIYETSSGDTNTLNDIKEKYNPIDVLFIDGDHTYNAVKRDFELYSDLVRPGGIIALHDISYNVNSVHYGVKPFWNELKLKYDKHLEIVTNPMELGIGVIYL